MAETMGKIIKRLRKDRNLTQEELAEQLGVTYQAVSKWENDSGLPDISQVVPLSVVLGVSTDVLFGRYDINDGEAVNQIIEEANAPMRSSDEPNLEIDCYNVLINGLKTYPNNTQLLQNALSTGCNILMDNQKIDDDFRKKLYAECIRHANLICNYSNDITAILSAHQWLIRLHCHYKEFDKAKEHAEKFPKSIHMQNIQYAWIARAEKDTDEEITRRCNTFARLLKEIDFELRPLGDAYKRIGKYAEAIEVYKTILNIVEAVYGDREYTPPMHSLAWVHMGLAQSSLLLGDAEAAIDWLEEEYNFNIKNAKHFNRETHIDVPSLAGCEFKFASNHYHVEDLRDEFNLPCFEKLKGNPRFDTLLKKVAEL